MTIADAYALMALGDSSGKSRDKKGTPSRNRMKIVTVGKLLAAFMTVAYCTCLVIFLRAIAAVMIVLGCSAFSQVCLLTTMAAERTVDCCEHEEPPARTGEKECARCITLESGVDRVAPEIVAVTEPGAVVDELLSALLALAAEPAAVASELDTSQPAAFSPLWHFVARTALPVRGPSLIA